MDDGKEKFLYESPDNGKTVYKRKFLETERELLYKHNPDLFSYNEFCSIVEASKDNKGLRKALDNLLVIYYTIKDDKSTT